MTTPIINPSTLSEEQRKVIKRIYSFAQNSKTTGKLTEYCHYYALGMLETIEQLFGKDFLESSAKPPCVTTKGGKGNNTEKQGNNSKFPNSSQNPPENCNNKNLNSKSENTGCKALYDALCD